jgi:hypothetical protein
MVRWKAVVEKKFHQYLASNSRQADNAKHEFQHGQQQ